MKRILPVAVPIALFVALLVALVGLNRNTSAEVRTTPLVVHVTARQRALVERYVKDVLLELDAAPADSNASMEALRRSARALLNGGSLPAPQGSLDAEVHVPPAASATLRAKFVQIERLIQQLDAQGTRLLARGIDNPNFADDLRELRATAALLSSATADAAGEQTQIAEQQLDTLDRADLVLAGLGALGAIAMALALWRTGTRQTQRLAESEARHVAILASAPDAIITADAQSRITGFNRSAERMFGYIGADVIGAPVGMLMPDEERLAHEEAMHKYVRSGRRGLLREARDLRGRRSDGSAFPIWLALSESNAGGEVTFTAIVRDLSERVALETRLEHLALHDALTGLPNRRLLVERIEQAQSRTRRGTGMVAVMFVDLDHFKEVNDTLGHEAGDRLLVEAANRIQHEVRDTDTVSRVGGDEFVVLCENIDALSSATELAQRIADRLECEFDLGTLARISASIGISLWSGNDESAEDLLRSADTAMYHAKESGRATWRLYDDAMQLWVDTRAALEESLRAALTNDELRVLYQPVVRIETADVCGFEALVRWERPGFGLLPPSEFIGVAEESGLIDAIGEFVLRDACHRARAWSLAGTPFAICANVSARQLRRDDFAQTVRSILEETGVEPRLITLELVEDALIADAPTVLDALHRLHALGIRIALDDFGTGFSSLTHLRTFPIDVVKIDQSIIGTLGRARPDTTVVAAVIAMARACNLEVVAEGVTSDDQVAALINLGCDMAQGYAFSEPLPADKAFEYAQSRSAQSRS